MFLEAGEKYEWFGPNAVEVGFKYFFESLNNSIFINIMLYPMREILGMFLYLEDEQHFSPMNEF